MKPISFAGIALLAAVALSQQACAQPAQTVCPDPALALESAVATTLRAVRGDDPAALLGQMSRDGVAFGTDGPLVSYQKLEADFAAKTGRYCDLFTCNGSEGDMHRLFSDGPRDTSVDAKRGLAAVFINANSNDELDLSYALVDCQWRLTGIGAP